ncbi:MAG: Lpg1974 family pore-forming outer membrane protein [Leptolyngbya sp. Prado105]|nr:Lpg1974 family pore-forming outer membrane protein [Leptolyngbya sp. Prado105]
MKKNQAPAIAIVAFFLASPAIAEPSLNPELLRKLQLLEQKQQELEQEIDTLRQQISPKTGNTPVLDKVTISAPEKRPQQIQVSAEALFLKTRTSNAMDFAIEDPGQALAVSGNLAKVRYDDPTALRVGLAYRPENTAWEVAATHMFFNSDGQQSAVRPAQGFLYSTLTHPVQNDSADTAEAEARMNYHSTDAELAYRFKVGQSFGVRVFGGLRFAAANQVMNVAYNGRDFNNATARIENRWNGFGPRMGAQVDVKLASDLSLFGRGAGMVLVGNRTTSYEETDNNRSDLVARISQDKYQTFVPGLEAALGISWQPKISQTTTFDISAGYEYQHLFNVSNSIRFVDGASPGVFSESQNDLSFQGFFIKLGINSEF